jgi:hypothetical protein
MGDASTSLSGGCDCKKVRYELTRRPLYVHCCHCTWCQRESGSAFAINALIESSAVRLTAGEPVLIDTPSESGKGQLIARCAECHVAVWSHYGGRNTLFSFIKVGTLDDPNLAPPDVHIFTRSKQNWVTLPDDALSFAVYYQREDHWPADSLQRFHAEVERHRTDQAS